MIGIVTAASVDVPRRRLRNSHIGGVAKTLAAAIPAVIAPATTAVTYALGVPMRGP